MPLLSVIIPVFNSETYLSACIESILKQTFQDFELILVDDGSTDKSPAICDDFQNKHKQIHVIHQQNQGLSTSRLNGLAYSTGNWISFVDNDDILPLDAFETLFSLIVNENDELIGGERLDLDNLQIQDILPSEISLQQYEFKGSIACQNLIDNTKFHIITPLWGKIYKRQLLERLDFKKNSNLCPTIYFEDILVTPLIIFHAKYTRFTNHIVYYHREHKESISRSGKMSSFYYEQLYSNQLLIQFYYEHKLMQLYNRQLKLYLRFLIFLYCNWYFEEHKTKNHQDLKQNIIKVYNITYNTAKRNKLFNWYEKLIYATFHWSSDIWLYTAGFLYFKVIKKIRYR